MAPIYSRPPKIKRRLAVSRSAVFEIVPKSLVGLRRQRAPGRDIVVIGGVGKLRLVRPVRRHLEQVVVSGAVGDKGDALPIRRKRRGDLVVVVSVSLVRPVPSRLTT